MGDVTIPAAPYGAAEPPADRSVDLAALHTPPALLAVRDRLLNHNRIFAETEEERSFLDYVFTEPHSTDGFAATRAVEPENVGKLLIRSCWYFVSFHLDRLSFTYYRAQTCISSRRR